MSKPLTNNQLFELVQELRGEVKSLRTDILLQVKDTMERYLDVIGGSVTSVKQDVQGHREVLFGDGNGKIGLIRRVGEVESKLNFTIRTTIFVIGPVVTVVVSLVVNLLWSLLTGSSNIVNP